MRWKWSPAGSIVGALYHKLHHSGTLNGGFSVAIESKWDKKPGKYESEFNSINNQLDATVTIY